ncbi:MAG: Gfo/Idh/MocA family oxidoreductase [Chloroflexi bacterium]|nr:Gfo/Idh/MocA family oxidoreductase [Chloroflexota bacterium]
MSKAIHFGIIGGGWRAEFYLRIARALPDRFVLDGMVMRNPAKAEAMRARWQVPVYASLDELYRAAQPEFIVTCVAWEPNPELIEELAAKGIAVLSETPPAPDLERLIKLAALARAGARIQVAEQYIYQPHHAARLAVVTSGLLGTVDEAQVSVCHGYHGMSLIRHFLGVGYENARITAMCHDAPLIGGPGRDGPPTTEQRTVSSQVIAWLDFGDKLGIYDFTGDQYFSWVRAQRLLLRGERGELTDLQVSYLQDFCTSQRFALQREVAGAEGNLEGNYLKGYSGNGTWYYRNPFVPGVLTDEEIAIATVLDKMGNYVRTGKDEPYPLEQACQDRYLDLMIEQALSTGAPVTTETQPWA